MFVLEILSNKWNSNHLFCISFLVIMFLNSNKIYFQQIVDVTKLPESVPYARLREAALLLAIFTFLLFSVLIVFAMILCYHRSKYAFFFFCNFNFYKNKFYKCWLHCFLSTSFISFIPKVIENRHLIIRYLGDWVNLRALISLLCYHEKYQECTNISYITFPSNMTFELQTENYLNLLINQTADSWYRLISMHW